MMTNKSLLLPLLAAALCLFAPQSALAAPEYRLSSTTYSMTLSTSLELKHENCRKNFGQDASLFDMKNARDQFANEADFNEALAAVFFKQPTAAFMVMFGGTDVPPGQDHDHKCYVVRSTHSGNSAKTTVDSYGNARVMEYNHEAQLLCIVPAQQESQPKEYVPKEAAGSGYKSHDDDNKKKGGGIFSFMNMFILFLVLGAFFVYKRRAAAIHSNGAGGGMLPSFSEAYYNVLDNKASTRTEGFDGDLGVHLTQGCELSYNPAVQGVV